MKIINTAPMSDATLKSMIESKAEGLSFTVVEAHRMPEHKLAEWVADADIVLGDYTGATPITRRIVQAAKNLKLIQQPSVGYNHIDVAACTEFGIPVANTPGANDIGVAEHTIMLAMACLKNLTFYNAKTHQGEWLFMHAQKTGIFELHGKTYGLLGMGRTARAVAARLVPFGVRLLYYDIARLSAEDEKKYQAVYASLEEIMKTADVVSIHLPLTETTANIIDVQKLKLMKPTAILINVGRGALVDETALADALLAGEIAMAAVDVFVEEPPPQNHPLFGLENAILTPHLAGSTRESGGRIVNMAMENMIRVMKGEKPLWVLNL
ncbi:MAG: hydroxyacid dehydrogenase [Deltaproteobacteria bacterium HGW-Deltaproteobacteria-6]|jgi:glyoxylate reductase|nr:MAG: hydroxyacid dehydrogenase [Deltaproteobacteria bacterium HGW-Deltaproteobacteria-6]